MEEGLKYSPLSLSFLGDAYMSLVVRRMLLEKGDMPVGKFHKASVKYVSADSQALIYDLFMEGEILSAEEKILCTAAKTMHILREEARILPATARQRVLNHL